MESKRVQIQRIIYQLVDLADDHTPMSNVQAVRLIQECESLRHRGYVTILKRLQSHYESETERFLCHQLIKQVYLNQDHFEALADLPYQRTPKHLWRVRDLLHKIPLFFVAKPWIRNISGLIGMSQHEDPYLRVYALHFLAGAAGRRGISYLFRHLCISQSVDEMLLTLDLLERTSVPGGAEHIICFLHRIKRFHSLSGFDQMDFVGDSLDMTLDCGSDFYHQAKVRRTAVNDFYYRALIVLSTQPRFTPAVAVAKKYLKKARYTGPALICLLQHSPLKKLRSNFQLFKRLLLAGKLTMAYPAHGYDPVVEGFRFFKRYTRLREETRNLFFTYITGRSMALPTEQFENLLDLADDFAI